MSERQVSWAADVDQRPAGTGDSSQAAQLTGAGAAPGPFRFSEAALAAAGVQDAVFLPAVVAGEVLSDEHQVPWPLRRCRFGPPLEAFNPEHSDLLQLKWVPRRLALRLLIPHSRSRCRPCCWMRGFWAHSVVVIRPILRIHPWVCLKRICNVSAMLTCTPARSAINAAARKKWALQGNEPT